MFEYYRYGHVGTVVTDSLGILSDIEIAWNLEAQQLTAPTGQHTAKAYMQEQAYLQLVLGSLKPSTRLTSAQVVRQFVWL